MNIKDLFIHEIFLEGNLIILKEDSSFENQKQTNAVFSEKWKFVNINSEKIENFQKNWYLKLYGFENETDLHNFLTDKKIVFDAGCGLGYKSAWFASLAPQSIVIGMDFSDSVFIAAEKYNNLKNLYFIKGDIANTNIKSNSIDYVSCDQVIHHTENPEKTFEHLTNITAPKGEFACYVYAKKALPRELLDDYFRIGCKFMSNDELWKMSESLTILGKTLSDLQINIDVPDIPALNIKGGKYDLQRFIYWNFIKCFWNKELGYDNSVSTNFDWYAPTNAKRYSEEEFKDLIKSNFLEILYFHTEEACYSGRFKKK
jgi:SAM-dependent methyltransferase